MRTERMPKDRPYTDPKLKDFSRKLRRDAPVPERLLWGRLRNAQIKGLKFRRQHPIAPYIADFYCDSKRLVVELDGMSHVGRSDYDLARVRWLEAEGYRVLRIGNDDVIQDLDAVVATIAREAGVLT